MVLILGASRNSITTLLLTRISRDLVNLLLEFCWPVELVWSGKKMNKLRTTKEYKIIFGMILYGNFEKLLEIKYTRWGNLIEFACTVGYIEIVKFIIRKDDEHRNRVLCTARRPY